jgi:alkylation response protein AidB-like acyl-CoA dehydrogenase
VHFAFTEDQRLFAGGLRDMLTKECPPSVVRAAWDDGTGHAGAVWTLLDDMGVLSILVDEAAGGLGGTEVDAVLLWQELGRAAVPGPVVEHSAVVAPLLGSGAAGAVGTVRFDGPYTPHAAVADVVVTADGVLRRPAVEAVESIDGGRRLAVVHGDTEPFDASSPPDLDHLRDRLALATAAFLVGLSEWMIATAAQHARDRRQFGAPIGTFQAVKHLLADALVQVEFAKAPVYRAAWSLATGAPTAARDVSMAKALANEAAYRTSRSTMQVHGGIGYTWEADLQLYMKKVWALMRAHGDTDHHRRRVTRHLLEERPATTRPTTKGHTT